MIDSLFSSVSLESLLLFSRNNLVFHSLFAGILDAVVAVRINRLQVPEVAKLGKPVVLDCDYTLEESSMEGLVVKWYFNERPRPIYQWIPTNKPQESGELIFITT